jgi:hypothetical protein
MDPVFIFSRTFTTIHGDIQAFIGERLNRRQDEPDATGNIPPEIDPRQSQLGQQAATQANRSVSEPRAVFQTGF